MVYNKDIMDWNVFPKYDIIWCDPPWNDRMVKFFETMMLKKGYKKPNNTIIDIITKLSELSDINKPIFIEYSVKGSELVIDLMCQNGHVFTKKITSTQSNGKPYLILVFNTDFTPNGNCIGFDIIKDVCNRFSFNTVFDPFAGIGKTANAFIKCNKTYIGSEINPYRFEKLKKVTWQEQQ